LLSHTILLGAIGPGVGAASPRRLEQGFLPTHKH
jgi:hypothetical protein